MIDNIKEIVKACRAQYRGLVDLDEKMVMLGIVVGTLALILVFAVFVAWAVIAFIKMAWPFVLGFALVALAVRYLRKEDSK